MAERAAKRARLLDIRTRIPYCSQSALAALLQIAEDEELPSASRQEIAAARDSVSQVATPYGELHQSISARTTSGGELKLEVQAPLACLWQACRVSAEFSELLKRSHAVIPSTIEAPWKLLLYCDEVIPGNQLAYNTSRKFWAWYWSILELGTSALADEVAWFEVLFIRQTVLKQIYGGLSSLFCTILRCFFSRDSHNLSTTGITLLLHDSSTLTIFIEFGMMLADEAALHAAYQFKGASGLKNCALCSNVFNWRSARDAVAADRSGIARYHTCCEIRDLRLHSLATLTAIANRLSAAAAAGMSQRNLAELETRLGFNYVPDGIMQDNLLRPLADPSVHLIYDTMHIYYVNGVFNNHVGRLVEALKPHGVTYATLRVYVSKWTWPTHVKKASLTDAFEGKRAKSSWDDGVFKCTASEALSLMPVLAQFVEASVLAMASVDARSHGACFMLLVKVLELIERSARGTTTPDMFAACNRCPPQGIQIIIR